MKVFVAGATGFVGSHVASSLVAKGHEVVGMARSEDDAKALETKGIKPEILSLDTTAQLQHAVGQSDAVFHGVAANNPDFHALNTMAINNMLDVLHGTGKAFVMQGGSMLFGDTGAEPVSEVNIKFNAPPPLADRVTLEENVLSASEKGVRSAIVYGSWVYGGQGAAIPMFMKQAAEKNGYSAIPGGGENLWATVHIEDWADLIAGVIENTAAKGIYFANAETHKVSELAKIIAQEVGVDTKTIAPDQLNGLWGPFTQPLAFMNQNFSSEKAEKELKWAPEHKLT